MTTAFSRPVLAVLSLAGMVTAMSCAAPAPPPAAKPSGDAAFGDVARGYLDDTYRRQPTLATFLGIHKYNELLRDPSRQAVLDEVAAARQFRDRAAAIDATTLSPANQLDREQLLLAIDSRVLTLETVRPWARDPDSYSSGLTNTAYIMIKRAFAPPDERLRQLDRAREGHARHARRGAQEPRQSAADLHRDRNRADRRQPRLLPDGGRVGLSHRDRQGAPRRIQAGQRRRHRRARRLQEVAAERPAETVERRLCDRRGDIPEEARRRRDARAAAR